MNRTREKDFLKYNYPQYGIEYCMEQLGLSRKQVTRLASRIGIRLEKTNYIDLILPLYDKSVYCLGFISGDGYVDKKRNSTTIEIVSEDAEKLDSVLMLLPWKKYKRKREESWKETTTYYIGDESLHTFLVDTGFCEKSQKTPDILSIIPENLLRFFLLGLFDADGCIQARPIRDKKYGHLQISASKDFNWSLLLETYEPLIVIEFTKRYTNHASTINLSNKVDIFKFYDYIYSTRHLDGIGLERKYLKFNEIS